MPDAYPLSYPYPFEILKIIWKILKFYGSLENLEILEFVAMFYTLYHIFKQESIQGSSMINGRHLALYQIFKTTVFTTKYMINNN
jgi:hypothetical protein